MAAVHLEHMLWVKKKKKKKNQGILATMGTIKTANVTSLTKAAPLSKL
jgi:hypothetical protein